LCLFNNMKREIIARKLEACNTRAQLLDLVEALIQQERESVIDGTIQNLDRSDRGYNRVVNRLMGLRQEK
jgi:hypothetical protein